MKTLKSHSGYLIIDHKDSPGIDPQQVPKQLRSSTVAVGKGQVYEADIKQCTHCERGVILNIDRIRSRGYCPYCHHYICDSCRKILDITGQCVPFRKVLDKVILTD